MTQQHIDLVLKFGGTSVATAERWHSIANVLRQLVSADHKPLVVCSAPAHVSNLLIESIEQALSDSDNTALDRIRSIYQQLGDDLQLDTSPLITPHIQSLEQLLQGVQLLSDISDRIRAKIMAHGELILTTLANAFLNQQQLNSQWLDARDHLIAIDHRNRLLAHCDDKADTALQQRFAEVNADLLITQGYIVADHNGETALLGRGGSDSSAAYFAAKLQVKRLEIWTDVPGIYTANPQHIAEARLLTHLNYNEAQEIASMGAKVLHPRCIEPVHKHRIPLHIKQTQQPERQGTVISIDSQPVNLPIKAIITKYNIVLISIESVNMWQQVGFLSDVFDCFKQHHLSIDLISTSEASVTVSIDNNGHSYSTQAIDALTNDLNQFTTARVIGPCASVSLIGENIRMVLHQLGPTFEVFESQQIHMMSLAANNLNLTFVIDSDQAERLAKQLHVLLVEQHPRRHLLGESWRETCGDALQMPTLWWRQKADTLLSMMADHKALYVYNAETITHTIQQLKSISALDQVFYAMKANSHDGILQQVFDAGLNFECVSIGEVEKIHQLFPNIDCQRILFTPNFAERDEYAFAVEQGLYITIDNSYPIENWPELFANQSVLLRVDPGYGAGHHKYVCTGGTDSKFGIPINQLNELTPVLAQHNINVIGLHIHSGSGILSANSWSDSFNTLLSLLPQFPEARIINLGGGLGIVEKPGQTPLDIPALNDALMQIKQKQPGIALWMEPGRFVVAQSGALLAKVTQVKHKGETTFVGLTTGMNSLIRPALYGAYHDIVNLSQLNQPNTQIVNLVGPICESGDTLGYCRAFPETKEGDVVLIANTGAYGYCMSSQYNCRQPAEEVFI